MNVNDSPAVRSAVYQSGVHLNQRGNTGRLRGNALADALLTLSGVTILGSGRASHRRVRSKGHRPGRQELIRVGVTKQLKHLSAGRHGHRHPRP
jgi:hypothetical protein